MIADQCSWDHPGHNPFMGDVVQAVAKYDLPKPTILALQAKMRKPAQLHDDNVVITRDGIVGKEDYTDLRMMHFGKGKVCRTVSRDKWGDRKERGLVFCADGVCVIVPTVCRNVSLVTMVPRKKPDEPIEMDPPSAGGGGPPTTLFGPIQIIETTPVPPPTTVEPPWSFPIVPPPSVTVAIPHQPPIIVHPPVIVPPPTLPPVPELPEWVLLCAGLLGVAAWRNHRKS